MIGPFLPRRQFLLQAGALPVGGLHLGTLLQAATLRQTQTLPEFRRAKACILLFMWGGPSHLDTLDPKPSAPEEVRGPFRSIATRVPGLEVSEHFRQLSQVADKVAIVRSLNHDDPAHLSSAHTTLTGQLPPVNKSDAIPPSDRDTPHIGSVMSALRQFPGALPSFVSMPWVVSHPAAPGGRAPGQHGGWLGHGYDPLMIEGDPNQPGWKIPALSLIDGQSPERLAGRRHLLQKLAEQHRQWEATARVSQLGQQQTQAMQLLGDPSVTEAFDLSAEPDSMRDRYGRNIHGQCVLLARRLVERGVPLVSVNWHNDGQNFWDTHGNNFNRLQNDLIPPSDRALATLLSDLDDRGLLDETLVVWVGEFGRRPQINNAGREHHPWCYSGLLAGGGIRGGQVYGASDATGHSPAERPVSPHDLVATMYHALGVTEETMLHDELNRPHRVMTGRPIYELF